LGVVAGDGRGQTRGLGGDLFREGF
jgi:hypothetical protein